MKKSKPASRLLFRYLQGTLTPKDEVDLEAWKLQSPQNRQFFDELSKEAKPVINTSGIHNPNIEARIFEKIALATGQMPQIGSGVRKMKTHWWKYAAAAAVLIVIAYGVANFTYNRSPPPLANIERIEMHDVGAPDSNYASITLANGQVVDLNRSSNGKLASQGKVELIKTDGGLIVYKASAGTIKGKMEFNTLSNPRGSRMIGMVLEDGSKVWLNAGSSLTYPVAFIGSERKVSITGEAYFEVAKNRAKPFRINKDGMIIEVLGTHFNVNAYSDEQNMKVTLLEGAVKVSSGDVSGLLKPGQQAKVKDNNITIRSDVNVDQVMAWKNGYFSFDRARITEVMRQLSRWYNIDVTYEGGIPDEDFGGDLRMSSKLSSILKVLEKTGVKFRIESNRVIVSR